ncbi:hypothetical protein MCEMIH15_00675 [Caulobacteraceae bacterium]
MSTKPKLISLSDLAIHPRLEPILSAIGGQDGMLFPKPTLALASTCALKEQVFTVVRDEERHLVTGPIMSWLPIHWGVARINHLNCRLETIPDPSAIEERGWLEILLLLAAWPRKGGAESLAREIISAMPEAIRLEALGLRGRSIAELGMVLKTSRHRLMGPKSPAPSAPSPGLGFSIDDLKRATRDER